MDEKVLKQVFTKNKMRIREEKWIEKIGNFEIFPATMKLGKIHVLGETLSRAPQVAQIGGNTLISSNTVDIQ